MSDIERAYQAEKSCKDCGAAVPPLYWHTDNEAFYCGDCVLLRDEQVKPLTPEQWELIQHMQPGGTYDI